MGGKLLLNFGAKFQSVLIYNFTYEITSQKLDKSKTHDCERNLSPLILKGNQMVY